MGDGMLLGALAAGLVVGYVYGRVRIWHRLRDWAWWEIFALDSSKPWARTRMVIALVVRADDLARGWRKRNDPPPAKRPAPKIHPKWLADTDGPDHRIRLDDSEGSDRG